MIIHGIPKTHNLVDKCFQLSFIQGNIKVLRNEVVDSFSQIERACSDSPSFKTKQTWVGGNTTCCLAVLVSPKSVTGVVRNRAWSRPLSMLVPVLSQVPVDPFHWSVLV